MKPIRMLDMGFISDILKIVSHVPKNRQTLYIFCHHMPKEIKILAHKILQNPFEINIATSKPAERILQLAYVVYNKQKKQL